MSAVDIVALGTALFGLVGTAVVGSFLILDGLRRLVLGGGDTPDDPWRRRVVGALEFGLVPTAVLLWWPAKWIGEAHVGWFDPDGDGYFGPLVSGDYDYRRFALPTVFSTWLALVVLVATIATLFVWTLVTLGRAPVAPRAHAKPGQAATTRRARPDPPFWPVGPDAVTGPSSTVAARGDWASGPVDQPVGGRFAPHG